MIGAANVNGKVANKKELQGYVTVPNKVVWDKEKIAEIEQAAQDRVNAAEAKAAQDIAAAAAENEKALAAKDKECEAKIAEVKAQSEGRVDNAINETIQGDYNYCEFVREEPVSDTDSRLCGYYRFYNDKITTVSSYAFAGGFAKILGNYWDRKEESDKYENRVYVTIDLPNCTEIMVYAFYDQTIVSELKLPKCRVIGKNAFYNSINIGNIKKLDLPECTGIRAGAFSSQPLTEINLPKCISIDNNSFYKCDIVNVSLPSMTKAENTMFVYCLKFRSIMFNNENITQIGGLYNSIISSCSNFKHIIIPNCTTVPKLGSVNGLVGSDATLKAQLTIYVPRAMVEQYKAATNWSAYNIAAIEDNRAELQGIFTELDELEGWN